MIYNELTSPVQAYCSTIVCANMLRANRDITNDHYETISYGLHDGINLICMSMNEAEITCVVNIQEFLACMRKLAKLAN